MSARHPALVVAAWELRRYLRWKDQLVGLVLFLAVGLALFAVGRVLTAKVRTATIAVEGVSLADPEGGVLRFVGAPASEQERLSALAEGELEGVLTRRPDGGFELLVGKLPRYRGELDALLADLVRRERLGAAGLGEEELARLLAPPALEVRFTDPGRARRGRGEKIAAGVFILLMLMTVFTAMAYLLTGITGEKQLRVTESVIAAIPPQAWIDGKILGITAYALLSVGLLVAGGLFVALGLRLATGFTLPEAAVRPEAVAVLALFSALGLFLWNTFYAAISATIDDPNTSSRSTLLLLPALPAALAVAVIRDPDGLVARILSLFPLTSMPAMPMRLVLSDPGWVEIALAAALLAGSVWALRRLAGRIFEIGMLLYGKEPTLREFVRWARARNADRPAA